MRKLVVLLAVATMLVLTALPAGAVTGDYVEDFDHPFVGLVVFYDEDGEFSHRCSGSLLTPIVFLTAGHCTDGVASARVYFQQDAGANYDPATQLDPNTGYPDYCAPGTEDLCKTSDELYDFDFADFADFPDIRDAGLVILDEPVDLSEYGVLPQAGTLDEFKTRRGRRDLRFTVSGYGLSESNPVHVTSLRERLMAQSRLTNVNSALNAGFNLQTNGNARGQGGTCSGDSGGPVFYPADTNVVIAVTSFGLNEWCRGVDFAFRIDQQVVLDWILETIPADQVPLLQFAD
jgi:hypothetical protein